MPLIRAEPFCLQGRSCYLLTLQSKCSDENCVELTLMMHC